MEYITIERGPAAFQQPVALHLIVAMCERAFGTGVQLQSVRELSGGTFNTTYRVGMAGQEDAILRVAPTSTARLFWHQPYLMRREQAIQPFLAPIARLVPRTLMADFTHELVDRDYVFQTYIPGEQWTAIDGELTPAEDEALWRQVARIAKTIHAVRGDVFGFPHPGRQFPTWSMAVIDMLERIVADTENWRFDATNMRTVLEIARAHRPVLDEIAEPHLLHGDLWGTNILVKRGQGADPVIVGVIDADDAPVGTRLFSRALSLHGIG